MVAVEKHLRLNLSCIGEINKAALLDSPVSAVVVKFREARAQSTAFKFIPRRVRLLRSLWVFLVLLWERVAEKEFPSYRRRVCRPEPLLLRVAGLGPQGRDFG